ARRGQLQREQQSRRDQQGDLLSQLRRLPDAGEEGPTAAGPALLFAEIAAPPSWRRRGLISFGEFVQRTPFAPAKAGAQVFTEAVRLVLSPRLRGDERRRFCVTRHALALRCLGCSSRSSARCSSAGNCCSSASSRISAV